MNLLYKYRNGNTDVQLYDDGTKLMFTKDNEFELDFAQNMDVKITNCCPIGCRFCHEGSIPEGKHGDIMNAKFIETLHEGTEIAIGGGAATSHPDLIPFLEKLKKQGVIANMTINQLELEQNPELIKNLLDNKLVWGLGISYRVWSSKLEEFVNKYPNIVIHLIAGIHGKRVFDTLSNKNAKILVLGYKHLRRGNDTYIDEHLEIDDRIKWLADNVLSYRNSFRTISFDNLALEQLNMKSKLNPDEWEAYYNGEDGGQTYYIDLVEKKFARMSTMPLDERFDLLDDAQEMFKFINNKYIRR